MKVPFPILGLHLGLPSEEQPDRTSFDLLNVRPYDVTSERIRGGQRPGLTKAYTDSEGDPLGGDHPILYMTSIVSTYITPES